MYPLASPQAVLEVCLREAAEVARPLAVWMVQGLSSRKVAEAGQWWFQLRLLAALRVQGRVPLRAVAVPRMVRWQERPEFR